MGVFFQFRTPSRPMCKPNQNLLIQAYQTKPTEVKKPTWFFFYWFSMIVAIGFGSAFGNVFYFLVESVGPWHFVWNLVDGWVWDGRAIWGKPKKDPPLNSKNITSSHWLDLFSLPTNQKFWNLGIQDFKRGGTDHQWCTIIIIIIISDPTCTSGSPSPVCALR